MKKQSYQERVQALAEKMAIVTFERFIAPSDRPEMGWAGLSDVDKKIWVDSEMEQARIAAAEVAEGIILYAYDGDMLAYKRNEPNGGYVTNYLKEKGLIPDDGQPDIEHVRPGDRMYGHKPHNPDNPEPETESIVERFEAIDEEGPEVRVTLSCGYRSRFWLMGLSDEEYIRRTQCMKEIDHGRDNMKIKGGQEAGSDD